MRVVVDTQCGKLKPAITNLSILLSLKDVYKRQELIKQAAPNGIKVNVVPIQKLIDASKDPRFGNTRCV